MFDVEKCILVTNNDRAAKKLGEQVGQVILLETYEEVLMKARDLIHTNHQLLSHPQASSLKPNQTPYRSILLYSRPGNNQYGDISLIEEAIQAFRKWNTVKCTPKYDSAVSNDYKTIDLSMLENIMQKL